MDKQIIHCGWGMRDITPDAPMPLDGQLYTRVAEYERDPLYATVMALRPGEQGRLLLWISVDLAAVGRELVDSLVWELQKRLPGFQREQLIMSATHTHTGPVTNSGLIVPMWGEAYRQRTPEGCLSPEEYTEKQLIPKLAQAAEEAVLSLTPSGFSPVLGYASIGSCRRVRYRDGRSVMYGSTNTYDFDCLEGPSDDGVELLYVYGEDLTLRGLVVNVCCPAQVLAPKSCYSADYIGCFRREMRARVGRRLPVLAIIGNAGNIAPWDLVGRGRGEPPLREPEQAEELGRRLWRCVEKGMEEAEGRVLFGQEYGYAFEWVPLPIRTVTRSEYALAREAYGRLLDQYGGDPAAFSQADKERSYTHAGVVMRWELQRESTLYDAPMHALRIGDSGFITNPFELYSEYGLRIISRSRAGHTFAAQLTDDSVEYLPTEQAIAAKSYSALVANCLVGSEGGEYLTERSIRMLNSLF